MMDITMNDKETKVFPWWILVGVIVLLTITALAKAQTAPNTKPVAANDVKVKQTEYKVKPEDEIKVRTDQVNFLRAGTALQEAIANYNATQTAVNIDAVTTVINAGADAKTYELTERDGKLVIAEKKKEEVKK